jgi:uncharacterized FAD-dependent dehydrogenase
MQKEISLKLKPAEAIDNNIITAYIAQSLSISNNKISGFYKLKQSIDARSKQQVWVNITVNAFIDEPFIERPIQKNIYQTVTAASKKVIIVGAGPAGLFAALHCLELGLQPIVLERGKNVRDRRRDLATLNKEGIVNPESNYCFGEGGAGTYSDGKLYTRSTKRGNINKILNTFVQFGAEEKILYEAHPHIGTNKLPNIITAIREQILNSGGKIFFEKKVTDFILSNNELKAITTADGDTIKGDAFIVATGHSARDIFELLHHKQITIEAKPFALGVRIEHPQQLIDSIQYHCSIREDALPPASYGLVEQVYGRGVFSFCMCPGGIIAPAATNPNELVVNGWSPSKRNNSYANSGMVVTVEEKDAIHYFRNEKNKKRSEKIITDDSPLTLLYFQQAIEAAAFTAGGGKFVAPAQRMVDFCNNKISADLPTCSYLPGISSAPLNNVLPEFVYKCLQGGFKAFGNKLSAAGNKGYYTNEAVIVATESRTSSPVRIPRDHFTLQHPQIKNLFPCGEGAGYAGGIISAAMDGERVAAHIALQI